MYMYAHENIVTKQSIYRILKKLLGNYRSIGDFLFSQYPLFSLYRSLMSFGSRNHATRI